MLQNMLQNILQIQLCKDKICFLRNLSFGAVSLGDLLWTTIQTRNKSSHPSLKKRLCHRCFPVNFEKFLRTPFLQNTLRRLLLSIFCTVVHLGPGKRPRNRSSGPEVFCKKSWDWGLQLYLKKRPWRMWFFCKYCEIFKNTFL